MQNIYRTKDIGLAAALLTTGKKLQEVNREGEISWFLFEGLDDCLNLDKQYWFSGLVGNLRTYKQNLDQLKYIVKR
jgi:hypothetical protein